MGYPSASRFDQVSGYIRNYLAHTDCPSILGFGDQTLILRAEQIDHIREFLTEYGAGSKYKKYEGRVGEQIYVSEVYRDAGIRHKCLDLNEKNNAIPIDLSICPNSHPLLADSPEQRSERGFELQSTTQKRIEEKA